jgi:hypothetical protein
MICDDCKGRGWILSLNTERNVLEVQRCGTCQQIDSDERAANLAGPTLNRLLAEQDNTDKQVRLSDLEAQIRAEVRDNFDEEAGATDFDPSDWLTELADSYVPIYNYDLLMLASEDLWLAVDTPEIYAFGGEHSAVHAIAGNVFDHLRGEAYSEFDQIKEEAENEQ